VIGLGVGTLATYGRRGDVIDFFEIDTTVLELARDFFRYVSDSEADVTLIPGDARLSLEHESPKNYDILVLDAFSSDAVPIHLLTSEAFDIYQKHLAPDGVIAAHISSQYFNLSPVLAAQTERLHWQAVEITDRLARQEQLTLPSRWVLMSPALSAIEKVALSDGATRNLGTLRLWTDSRHSLYEMLLW
jgi:spermidine synthase